MYGMVTALAVVFPVLLVFGHDGLGIRGIGPVGHERVRDNDCPSMASPSLLTYLPISLPQPSCPPPFPLNPPMTTISTLITPRPPVAVS